MKLSLRYFFLILLILISSCSKEEKKVSIVKETNLEAQMIEAYNSGLEELNKGDAIYAAKDLMKLNFFIHNQNGRQELL